jgi:hypothetical protein
MRDDFNVGVRKNHDVDVSRFKRDVNHRYQIRKVYSTQEVIHAAETMRLLVLLTITSTRAEILDTPIFTEAILFTQTTEDARHFRCWRCKNRSVTGLWFQWKTSRRKNHLGGSVGSPSNTPTRSCFLMSSKSSVVESKAVYRPKMSKGRSEKSSLNLYANPKSSPVDKVMLRRIFQDLQSKHDPSKKSRRQMVPKS